MFGKTLRRTRVKFFFCFIFCFCFVLFCFYFFGSMPGYFALADLTVFASGEAGKARFNVATPTNATVTCTTYVLPYNLQTKSI